MKSRRLVHGAKFLQLLREITSLEYAKLDRNVSDTHDEALKASESYRPPLEDGEILIFALAVLYFNLVEIPDRAVCNEIWVIPSPSHPRRRKSQDY